MNGPAGDEAGEGACAVAAMEMARSVFMCHFICHYRAGLLGSREKKKKWVDDLKDEEKGVGTPSSVTSNSWLLLFFCLPKPFVGRSNRLGGTIFFNELRCIAICRFFPMCR